MLSLSTHKKINNVELFQKPSTGLQTELDVGACKKTSILKQWIFQPVLN